MPAGRCSFHWMDLGDRSEDLSAVPVKWILNTLFAIIYDRDLGQVLPTILLLAAGTVILLGLCRVFFHKEDYV